MFRGAVWGRCGRLRSVAERDYVPALRFPSLTRVYDPVAALTTREREYKSRLLDQAAVRSGQKVLDVGCGTGTLLLAAAERCPGAELSGLDADEEMLERAREKTAEAGAEIEYTRGSATEMPYRDRSFDVVVSSLFFHHLTEAEKLATAREVARVLKRGGELHVADFGRGTDPAMRALFFAFSFFDGRDRTRANGEGRLPEFFAEAGFADADATDAIRTPFGTIALYRARKTRR
jgi:SAM-dependent methyltransferase